MKTQKLKTIGRNLGVLSVTALMLASCGSKDENKAAPAPSTNTSTNLGPVFNNPGAQNDGNLWNSLKSQVSCSQGRMSDLSLRMNQVSNSYGNSVSGYLESGTVSGNSTGSYYGKSPNGDVIYVSKVTDGNSLVYNVVISFCNYNDGQYNYIGDGAGMTNFFLQNVTLNNGSNCATGAVTDGYVGFYSPAAQSYVPIRFVSAGINCY